MTFSKSEARYFASAFRAIRRSPEDFYLLDTEERYDGLAIVRYASRTDKGAWYEIPYAWEKRRRYLSIDPCWGSRDCPRLTSGEECSPFTCAEGGAPSCPRAAIWTSCPDERDMPESVARRVCPRAASRADAHKAD